MFSGQIRGPVSRAVERKDAAWLKGWITATFGVEPSDKLMEDWLQCAYYKGYQIIQGPDDDMRLWFSNRLREAGMWPCVGKQGTEDIRLGCDLHCFFIYLEETEDMLIRLRNEPKYKGQPSTPGIERTQVKVQPIDRVAARGMGE